jgi:hypothetical protein
MRFKYITSLLCSGSVLSLCMYVCIHAGMVYSYMYVCMYTRMYVFMYIYTHSYQCGVIFSDFSMGTVNEVSVEHF